MFSPRMRENRDVYKNSMEVILNDKMNVVFCLIFAFFIGFSLSCESYKPLYYFLHQTYVFGTQVLLFLYSRKNLWIKENFGTLRSLFFSLSLPM